MPAAGGVSAFVLGTGYAYAQVYKPFHNEYLVLFLLGALAVGVGVTLTLAARLGHCRNGRFARVTGVLIGLLAVYAVWAAFMHALINKGVVSTHRISLSTIWAHPRAIWEFAKVVEATGWESISGRVHNGWAMWLFWAGEAILIVLCVTWLAPFAIVNRVYCERCGRWAKVFTPLARLVPPNDSSELNDILNGNLSNAESLPSTDESTYPYLIVNAHLCSGCTETATWNIAFAGNARPDATVPAWMDYFRLASIGESAVLHALCRRLES
ncbi:MAG: hypothetical protein HYR83_14565 [Planctomycetes bacterium]|nr:hypothetical protein [Planctomycetota bacterium]